MQWMNVHQVAQASTIPARTLWRWANGYDALPVGPAPSRLGPKQLRYRTTTVARWLGITEDELLQMLGDNKPKAA